MTSDAPDLAADPEKSTLEKASEFADYFLKRSQEANKLFLQLRQNAMQSSLSNALGDQAKILETAYSELSSHIANGEENPAPFLAIINKGLPAITEFTKPAMTL